MRGPRGETRPTDRIGCAIKVARIATGEVEDTRLKQPAKRQAGKAGAKVRMQGKLRRPAGAGNRPCDRVRST